MNYTHGSCYGFPVHRLLIAYMDDETPPVSFEMDRYDTAQRITERTAALHEALSKDTVPAAEPRPLCHYCTFKTACGV